MNTSKHMTYALLLLCATALTYTACGQSQAPLVLPDNNENNTQDMSQSTSDASKDANDTKDISETKDMPDPNRFKFEGEEVACAPNASFKEAESILQGGKINPTGRGEHQGVYDPCHNRIILFGGNDHQPAQCDSFSTEKNYLADTWAYSLEYDNWYRIKSSDSPPARGRHVAAFDYSRKKAFIFGGRYRPQGMGGNYTLYNDLWAFDVNTDTWKEITQNGAIPSARTNGTMIYDPVKDQLVLFGGNSSNNGLNFTPLGDTRIFDLKTNTWENVITTGPPARLFHVATYDESSRQMIIFAGGNENAFVGDFYKDVWAFHLDDQKWTKLWSSDQPGTAPLPRISAGWMADPKRNRVILFGGHDDGFLGNANDLWSFDLKDNTWKLLRAGDVYTGAGCQSFCMCAKDFVTFDKESPERRQYPTFVKVQGEDKALLFSGTGDCGYMDDTWSLDLETMKWTEQHPPEQGIACERTGRQDCEELCF